MHVRSDMARIIAGGLFSGSRRSLRSLGHRFGGVPAIWTKRRHLRMRWIDGQIPDSEEAETIRQAIVVDGCETYGDIARDATDRLFRRDHAAAGWVADIGLFHGWYLLHVCLTLERLNDRLVQIEGEARSWT